jgi:hypothetical protein
MPHPIIHSQASNPELLHTVNSKQPGGGGCQAMVDKFMISFNENI